VAKKNFTPTKALVHFKIKKLHASKSIRAFVAKKTSHQQKH
jgi:hypothetical protein